ncbi:TetR/AcrR family transcriptional regulator [uncultured Fusobacterium sp.]|uniref:TetR/AcrR family transcriptional regulator n=1 Tax=uncultured Fusobacterium sp. TaxID=159267 RepID=UPI0015A5B25A|nr:TetR/AcrR family transcriptional regulator [uncultured Fusobacterium sp.]
MDKKRKDRRSEYTCAVIKESFLSLLKEKSYDKISISEICKNAEVTRATFYLHYSNLDELFLEVLDEALEISKNSMEFEKENATDIFLDTPYIPICQRTATNPKYNVLFLDPILSEYIANKLYHHEKKIRLKQLQENFNLTEFEAEKLYTFIFFGNFAVNKSLRWEKNKNWNNIQNLIRDFITLGLSKKNS